MLGFGLEIKLIELPTRRGPASARNAAIEASAGAYIAFLDDDDVYLPDHLRLGCGVLDRNEADFVYLGAIVSNRRLRVLPTDLSGLPVKAYPYDQRFLSFANFLHTGAVIVRSFRVSGVRFDPQLDVCEDWDLWWR